MEEGARNKVSEKRKKIEFPVKSPNPKRFSEYCEMCDVKAWRPHVWKAHLQGRRHQESLKNLAERKVGAKIIMKNCRVILN